MRAVNTLRLARRSVFFGPGPRQLLAEVEALSSLRQATLKTGISYTKALRLLRAMERELGFAVVESVKGGSEHGGTRLTERGARLLHTYAEVEAEVAAYAQQVVLEKLAFLEK